MEDAEKLCAVPPKETAVKRERRLPGSSLKVSDPYKLRDRGLFGNGFLAASLAIEDNIKGIWR